MRPDQLYGIMQHFFVSDHQLVGNLACLLALAGALQLLYLWVRPWQSNHRIKFQIALAYGAGGTSLFYLGVKLGHYPDSPLLLVLATSLGLVACFLTMQAFCTRHVIHGLAGLLATCLSLVAATSIMLSHDLGLLLVSQPSAGLRHSTQSWLNANTTAWDATALVLLALIGLSLWSHRDQLRPSVFGQRIVDWIQHRLTYWAGRFTRWASRLPASTPGPVEQPTEDPATQTPASNPATSPTRNAGTLPQRHRTPKVTGSDFASPANAATPEYCDREPTSFEEAREQYQNHLAVTNHLSEADLEGFEAGLTALLKAGVNHHDQWQARASSILRYCRDWPQGQFAKEREGIILALLSGLSPETIGRLFSLSMGTDTDANPDPDAE